jgi:hypothetical protein
MGNAGFGNADSYNQHFRSETGFVSEYGSISLPNLESLKKELSPEEMWSDKDNNLPRWHGLPINISAYSYLSSYDYDGLASMIDRLNQYADRHVRSVQDLIDDSQVYQAFLMKYATEAYRRKKYEPVNGTRFWDYGEVWPGIRWGIIDYFRTPKMSYYAMKQAQARFALNFAYEEALESQVSGKRLQIPVWIINDHTQNFTATVRCQIQDLAGHVVWSSTFEAPILADGKKEVGLVDWVAPDTPGVYTLRGQATSQDGQLNASTSTFIKVTPRLFARPFHMLLIAQRKYETPIAEMMRAAGVSVDVINEGSLAEMDRLRDAEQLRKKYDLVWLAAFDSFWKLLDGEQAEGLKKAVREGVGLIHTGGRGSFHGGFGEGAGLDLTGLADILPVELQNRYDLVLGQVDDRTTIFSTFSPQKDIREEEAGAEWGAGGMEAYGLMGFNNTRVKDGSHEILSIAGHPLLVVGQYGQGRTVAFTGFTPGYSDQHAEWDARIIYPYLVDQEMYRHPVTRSYFYIFMELIAAASGENPQLSYDAFLMSREEPLFEMLKDLPAATLKTSETARVEMSGADATLSFTLANGDRYARLLRVRAEWDGAVRDAPDVILFDDNYFDLLPAESRTVNAKIFFPQGKRQALSGKLIVMGTNLEPTVIKVNSPERQR